MEQNENTKVYTFDLSQFKKNTLKKLIAYSIFIAICFSVLIYIAYIRFEDAPVLFYILCGIYTLIVIYILAKQFSPYFRANQIHHDDNITIYKQNGHIISVDIKMQETKYDEFYSITKITELHRKNYIDVEGVIYNENSSDDATDLRIPSYFESMNEIYKALEKMKEQA